MNFMDFVGLTHNRALSHMFDVFGSNADAELTSDRLLKISNSFLRNELDFELPYRDCQAKLQTVIDVLIALKAGEIRLMKQGKVSVGNEVSTKIENLLHGLANGNMGSYIHQTKQLEQSISRDPNVSVDEAILLLSSLSVAQNSALYWQSIPTESDTVDRRWMAADVMGAWTSYQVSLAGVGGAIGGAVGFFGVMAAVGAGCSYMNA